MNHIHGTDMLQKRIKELNTEIECYRKMRIVPDDSAWWMLIKVGTVAFFAALGVWYLLVKVGGL